ncbi:Cytochrome p450 [Thalictrum thalictroides]|uniref:Cytochrome p450 n=1 Tax=Thalictrum thalictroides TaxID=46969 RepID=A0A7J6VIF8_THATH|nr:Cytochrome p450 [Thalictrum thalictroides]
MLEALASYTDMSLVALVAVSTAFFVFLLIFLKKDHRAKNVPKGSLGLPLIGETMSFIRAQSQDHGMEWIYERVSKYGPVFKTSLMGAPTVIITGQAGNKFVLGSDEEVLVAKQPFTISAISGKHTLFELKGNRYKLIKGAMVSFLKPESLQNYIRHMDDLIAKNILRETKDKDTLKAVDAMKRITFNVACTTIFGIEDEMIKKALLSDSTIAFKAIWSIPVNIPGTGFWKGIEARGRIINQLLPIIKKKREELINGTISPKSDIISCLLALKEENQEPITEQEILDNFIMLMFASHDTSTILLSLMILKLAKDPKVYEKIREEQMGILSERQKGHENLTWSEIQKMKYTWRVAQELMRITPPVFGSFRKAVKDTSFGGYDIPKGWQVFWVASTTHLNKDIFNNPMAFDPSRFDSPVKPIPPYAYIPFGAGSRMCIGNEFGRVETLIVIHHMVTKFEWSPKNYRRKNLPKGSLGLPIFGESISFLRAANQDHGEDWIQERVSKYGHVFKTSLMGSPTVVITGQTGNKFVLSSDYDVLAAKQPKSISAIAGKYQLFELSKTRYMLVKQAMVSFLKPESLQHHIKDMDSLIFSRLVSETKNKDIVKAVDLMKKITFEVSCTVLFGIYDEPIKEALLNDFTIAFKAFWSIPIKFPGTIFKKGLDARARIVDRMLPIIRKKKEDLMKGIINPKSDVISCLLSLTEENAEPITEIEVMDNFITLMIASHDTSAILSSLMIWKLARDKKIYDAIREEQMTILSERKKGDEKLTWNEIQKMKYTWRVAQELMRIIPPVFGSFRTVVKDTSFAGYDIPKGWQVFWVACGTHMNKNIFDDPNAFEPSRFDSPSKPIPPYTYIPFGAGTHMCIGNEFGRVETLAIIHHLVTKFEWSQMNPDEDITRQPMPYPSMGLPIKLKPIIP